MKLLFKQRLFSWFDSYDVYNEFGEVNCNRRRKMLAKLIKNNG